jgi:DNA-binding transcriptional MerR regulator
LTRRARSRTLLQRRFVAADFEVDMTSTNANPAGFSGTATAEIVGISYRQLDYWARTDLVRPSLSDASGSGSRRRYSYSDLLELRVIKNLLDAGIKLESVREVFEYLRAHVATDIASAHIVIQGSSVMLCDGEELIDVVRRGQGVLNLLSLESVKQEIDDKLIELRPIAPSEVPRTAVGV